MTIFKIDEDRKEYITAYNKILDGLKKLDYYDLIEVMEFIDGLSAKEKIVLDERL